MGATDKTSDRLHGWGDQLTRAFDAIHARDRSLAFRIHLATTFGLGLLTAIVGTIMLAVYLDMSRGELLVQLVAASIAATAASAATLIQLRHELALARDWSAHPPNAEAAPAAWLAIASFPQRLAMQVLPWTLGLTAALGVLGVVIVGEAAWAVLPVVAGGEVAALSGIALVRFWAELGSRPMLEEAWAHLSDEPLPPRNAWSMRAKILGTIPLLSVVSAITVGAVDISEYTGAERVLVVSLLAFPAAAFATSFFFVVTRSVLDPIVTLTRATERAAAGDLDADVPVISTDELGILSASFNRMLVGLREREQLRDELQASRARILAASDAERRRVERNIHDGAQQQLVALALRLRALQEEHDVERLHEGLDVVADRLKGALGDLRELARGLHPSILTTDGLAPAVEQLANRAAIPVTITVPDERYDEQIESTAYFIISEALANVTKYAHASTATVTVERREEELVVAVTDDGIGGARTDAGSGVIGLVDRVAALGGTLTLDSPRGQGTTVNASIPLPTRFSAGTQGSEVSRA